MKPTTRGYDRRTVLRTIGAAAVGTAVAGCLGDDTPEGNVLSPPENYERQQDLDLPYPAYGEEVPSVTVPAPRHDREVTTTEFVGERHTMLTFVYTNCVTVCPGLVASLRRVQGDSVDESYADDFAFLPTTFDPEQDTPEVIDEYCESIGVNFDANNWYFLRPETPERAEEVVEDTFGVAFEGGEMNDGDGDMGDGDMGDGEHARHFQHLSLVLLVNKNGIVERAYNGGPPEVGTGIDDARKLVERW